MWFSLHYMGLPSPSSDTLSKAGYTNVHIVPEQAVPNGDFPTVKSQIQALNGISFS
jgi:hypothetical protein